MSKRFNRLERKVGELDCRIDEIETLQRKEKCSHPLEKRTFYGDDNAYGKALYEDCKLCGKTIHSFDTMEDYEKARKEWHRECSKEN